MTVLVINTHSCAVGMYENYPFTSYCEVGGLYFGVSPSGLCQIDVSDTDAGAPINAGLSTGHMKFKDDHQKYAISAYMTLRNTGTLTLSVTVDDGARMPPVVLQLPNFATPGFIQRRVPIPRGLRGEFWRFELNNTEGADFDFGQLGITMAASTRRI